MITHEELLELLDYDKNTGIFRWKKANNKKIKIGSIAGHKGKNGFGRIKIGNGVYDIHRLAWFYVNAKLPTGFIFHINGIKTDNRISNLIEAPYSNYFGNIKNKKNNIYYNKRYKKWHSTIMIYGNNIYLGQFDTEQEAKNAVTNYKLKLEESGIL